jgi:hypothetical protein
MPPSLARAESESVEEVTKPPGSSLAVAFFPVIASQAFFPRLSLLRVRQ